MIGYLLSHQVSSQMKALYEEAVHDRSGAGSVGAGEATFDSVDGSRHVGEEEATLARQTILARDGGLHIGTVPAIAR